ncbi:MAG: amidohydrolase family protein [Chloroflexota bacterium]|nr:amidohydrolase family protein [Chloroflexota bacterium]
MIVDVHTHAPRHRTTPAEAPGESKLGNLWRPDKTTSTAVTWDDYMEAMKIVDRAIVFNIASDPREETPEDTELIYPAPQVNDDTAALVHAYPDKLIGFMTVNPHSPDALAEMDRCVGDLGLRGLKLGPNYQHFDPLGPEAFRVFGRAQELGLPVLLHQGTSPVQFAELDYAHPRHLDVVAREFPRLKMIVAHMGHPWQVECFVVIRKHPNLFADISANFYRPWSCYNAFRHATEWGVMHKLLFGSDYPIVSPQETLNALQHVNDVIAGTALPPVPQDELDKIPYRNSLELLGLD